MNIITPAIDDEMTSSSSGCSSPLSSTMQPNTIIVQTIAK